MSVGHPRRAPEGAYPDHTGPSLAPSVGGAWLRARRRLLWATLRAGQAGPATGARALLAHALPMLPMGHQSGMGRADSGFFVPAFLEAVAARDVPDISVARLTPLLRKLGVHRIAEAGTGGWWLGASRWRLGAPRGRPGGGSRAGVAACASPWPSPPPPGGDA